MDNRRPRCPLLISAFAAIALAPAGGCHADVFAKGTDSATNENELFGESEPTTSESWTPTTSEGDTEPALDPQDACELHPQPGFPGLRFECAGSFATALVFDYYGASDVPINSLVPCVDLSDALPKQPGYLYTCFAKLQGQHFGPDAEQASVREVEACCLADSPAEAVDPFCRIDAAQDICIGVSDHLNDLRKQIPFLPKFKEVNQQLKNLNYFLAASDNQSDCAQTFAKGFLAVGDIVETSKTVDWQPTAEVQLDPDDGWPWFRAIDMNVTELALAEMNETDRSCLDSNLPEPQTGVIPGGRLAVSDGESKGEAQLSGGSFAFRRERCSASTCDFQLDALRLDAGPLTLGGFEFEEITAELTVPAVGKISGERVRIPGQGVTFTVRARIIATDGPGGDEVQMFQLRARGDMLGSLSINSGFSIESVELFNWPIEIELATEPGAAR